jgi:uncharacterized NAD(P)/FAD-binding protein YdhS
MTVMFPASGSPPIGVSRSRSVAIVGGGASGVLLAAHLLRGREADLDVFLVERRNQLGRGLAYATDLQDHLLNVRASNMSALPDDPGHFVDWLRARGVVIDDPAAYFAPRRVYGEYLQHLLEEARAGSASRLHVVDDECVALTRRAGRLELRLSDGSSLAAGRCVLATGHDGVANRGHSLLAPETGDRSALPDPSASVLLVGSGLSMVDTCLALLLGGHQGEILAVSRRGLLPAVHRNNRPIALQRSEVPYRRGPAHLMRWLRRLVRAAEAGGGDWRDVLDGLRPHTQAVWQNWSIAHRRQFFRHVKAWWDVHRHRMAPRVSEQVSNAMASGQLRVIAGRINAVIPDEAGFTVELRRRDSRRVERVRVGQVYDCAGLIADPGKSTNPLIQSLLSSGLARTDALRIGLDVAIDGAVIGRNGSRSDLLYAVGPLTRGTFFEIEAIPDIRVQCQRLAATLLAGQNLRSLAS